MCGIAGIIKFKERLDEGDKEALEDSIKKIHWRGPDEEGIFVDENLALAHKRLAIIDIAGGRQPMIDKERGNVIVYNGEIYNFKELRVELENAGEEFKTQSDTEVLLKGWGRWHEKILEKLNGIFAFAIFEPAEKKLFLVRDRVGVKPLFYCYDQNRFIFSSSVAGICAFPDVERGLDITAISHYLTSIRTTFDRRTLIKGIQTLLPAEILTLDIAQKEVSPQIKKYWDFPLIAAADKMQPDIKEAAAFIHDLIEQAISLQLISDVPLGGFLSGGLDSSIIALLARRLTKGNFNAYSVGYDIEGYNEWEYIRLMTAFCRMRCEEIHLAPADYPADWKMLIQWKGLPLSTPNEVPIYHLAKALKREFTVALSGEGADEVFGGYVLSYLSAFDYERARHSENLDGNPTPLDRAIKRLYGRDFLLCPADQFFLLNSWVSLSHKKMLLADEVWNALNMDDEVCAYYEDMFAKFSGATLFDQLLHIHGKINLEGLLSRVDSSTMAASVEARVPFTDHRIIEYLFALPDDYKIRFINAEAREKAQKLNAKEIDREGFVESKFMLRKAFEGELPEEIIKRRKMSFPVPVREWFGELLKPFIEETIYENPLLNTIFNRNNLIRWIRSSNLPLQSTALWPVVNLCLWVRECDIKAEF
jgi:asparagine synthase (glutamine-hydrolysing)